MSKIDKLMTKLKLMADVLIKSLAKDDIDKKIKAKLEAEMKRRGFTETDAVRHIIDRDRGEQQPPKPKEKPLLQSEHEVCKFNNGGQWSIEKSNAIKPFGQNIYDQKANIERKAKRIGEEQSQVGPNKAIQPYTTTAAAMARAHAKAQEKEQRAKTKASTRTFADMSDEEKEAMRAQYEKKD